MTSQFTKRALKVMNLAHREAKSHDQRYIGTEHLLLGLIHEKGGLGAQMLRKQGVDEDQVRQHVGLPVEPQSRVEDSRIRVLFHRLIQHRLFRNKQSEWDAIGLTPSAKKSIELAIEEAQRLNHHYIGTEHILLGLVREGENTTSGLLESLDIEKIRTQVRKLG